MKPGEPQPSPALTRGEARAGGRRLRVLYLMHVDWGWIKQRPHFLAEALADDARLDVRVLYMPSWHRRRLTGNPSHVRRAALPPIPVRTWPLFATARSTLSRFAISIYTSRWRPDVLWISSPSLQPLIPSTLDSVPRYYDNMDVADGFGRTQAERLRIRSNEDRLISSARQVICSSRHIADLVAKRHPGATILVVRNGYDPTSIPTPSGRKRLATDPLRIGYFGTIAPWIDFQVLIRALEAHSLLEFHLWGPMATEAPVHARLLLHDALPHAELHRRVDTMDGYIMPFLITPLTQGVDPVKMYEYVAHRKPILARYYPGLEPFRPFTMFYQSAAELISELDDLISGRQPVMAGATVVDQFLASSSWTSRGRVIADVIAQNSEQC